MRETLDFLSMEQKELAAKTGLSLKTIENYVKKDSSIPSADRAVLIAQALGVTVEFLVTGQDGNKKERWQNHTVHSIKQMLIELNDKDLEIILGLTKRLKDQQKYSTG